MTHAYNKIKLFMNMVITLNSEEFDRMEKKTPEQRLKYDLENEFGFSAIVARALLNKIASYNSSNNSSNLPVGIVFYWATSSKEPAGKPIEEMKLIQAKLTLNEAMDISVLRKSGMQALREVKIARITEEAQNQDTYLTQEDIAVLLCSSVRTIRRDIERLRKRGINIPTRGQKMDIGKGVSHKTQIIDMLYKFFFGKYYTKSIAAAMKGGHSAVPLKPPFGYSSAGDTPLRGCRPRLALIMRIGGYLGSEMVSCSSQPTR